MNDDDLLNDLAVNWPPKIDPVFMFVLNGFGPHPFFTQIYFHINITILVIKCVTKCVT